MTPEEVEIDYMERLLRTYIRKLTPEQVIEIVQDQRPQGEIAAQHGVSETMVGLIKSGQRYARITQIEPTRSHRKLTPELRA